MQCRKEETSMFAWGTKTQSPEISTVMQWRPPDGQNCGTDPSLSLSEDRSIETPHFQQRRHINRITAHLVEKT